MTTNGRDNTNSSTETATPRNPSGGPPARPWLRSLADFFLGGFWNANAAFFLYLGLRDHLGGTDAALLGASLFSMTFVVEQVAVKHARRLA
jgi:hypothetical protein